MDGKWADRQNTRKTARKIEIALRRQRLVEMRIKGYTWQQIADELGYSSAQNACNDLNATMKRSETELSTTLDAYRQLELERLNDITRRLEKIYSKRHVVVQRGEIVRDENDEALEDDGPLMQAIDRMLKVAESRRKLLGTDAPDRMVSEIRLTIDGIPTEELP